MTKVPKILYHGTTTLRYAMIKRSGKMDSHMPKHYRTDRRIDGYLFFTDSASEASICGLNTALVDLRMSKSELKTVELYNDPEFGSSVKDPIVLAVRTSLIKDRFDIDPDYYSIELPGRIFKGSELLLQRRFDQFRQFRESDTSIWYRYQGDLSTKFIFPYKYTPYSWYEQTHPQMIDGLNVAIDLTELVDTYKK